MECGKEYDIQEYIDEIDERMWERLSCMPCDRV